MTKQTSQFLSELHLSKVSEASSVGQARWKLDAPLDYFSEIWGFITVPTGFETDLASVPRIPFAYWFTGNTAHASAVVHDWLCSKQYVDGHISWKTAADIFKEAMTVEKVPTWRKFLMYWAVRFAEPDHDSTS